jgi:hypothetical protein
VRRYQKPLEVVNALTPFVNPDSSEAKQAIGFDLSRGSSKSSDKHVNANVYVTGADTKRDTPSLDQTRRQSGIGYVAGYLTGVILAILILLGLWAAGAFEIDRSFKTPSKFRQNVEKDASEL